MKDTMESITAKLCSFARAYHSNFDKDKIFDDYLAFDMMGKTEYEEAGQLIENGFMPEKYNPDKAFDRKIINSSISDYIAPIPLSRAAFTEQRLNEFAKKHKEIQYVICGAGMDTFSFRNTNPNIKVFELDHPNTQKYKKDKIKELEWIIPDNVRFVPVDFAKDSMEKALIRYGFNRQIPTFFAILGVTYHLTLSTFEDTIAKIANLSSAESKVVFDFPDETTFSAKAEKRTKELALITEKLGEPMLHGYSVKEISEVLKKYKYKTDIHETPQIIQQKYFDGRTDGQKAFENIHFISAVREEKQKMNTFIFTSESVTEGHPDKVSDIISDSILDAYLEKDKNARTAVETMVKNNTVILAGEISSSATINIEQTVRNAIYKIGYNHSELGFDSHSVEIIVRLDKQSADIAQGVNNALETRNFDTKAETGAGDQGMVFGYASDETEEYMPLAISLAHSLAKRLSEVRKNNTLPYLRPDGKTQVSIRYENDTAVFADTVLVSTQHNPDVSQEQIREDIIREVITPVIPEKLLSKETKILINPTGRFVIGGPVGDSGLTGRKIIVDTYGGSAHHGGGAFSGKDPTKVDRSAAYAARYAAKNIVAAHLAKKAEIQIAYAIGVAAPVSVYINTFGTGIIPDSDIQKIVTETIDFRPGAIIDKLNLRQPIYKETSAYGHFGRKDITFPWEKTDLAGILREKAGKIK